MRVTSLVAVVGASYRQNR